MAEPFRPLVRELVCMECDRAWLHPGERWRLYLNEDDPPRPVLYCPDCAGREFD